MTNGTKVKTNQGYFDKFGRMIYGVIENNVDPNNPSVTMVRVKDQEGNVIIEHQNQLLVMMKKDLEIVESEI